MIRIIWPYLGPVSLDGLNAPNTQKQVKLVPQMVITLT